MPMSSAPERRLVPSRRAMAPSRRRRPKPSRAARTCGAGSHRPVGTSTAAARSSRWAAARRGPSSADGEVRILFEDRHDLESHVLAATPSGGLARARRAVTGLRSRPMAAARPSRGIACSPSAPAARRSASGRARARRRPSSRGWRACTRRSPRPPSSPCGRASRASRPGWTAAALERRVLVKTWAMRGTLHLAPRRRSSGRTSPRRPSCRRGTRRALAQGVRPVGGRGRGHARGDPAGARRPAADAARRSPRPSLGRRGSPPWPTRCATASARCSSPRRSPGTCASRIPTGATCVSPGRSRCSAGRSTGPSRPRPWSHVVRRYLGTYGPASREELARWFGMASPALAGRCLRALGEEVGRGGGRGGDGRALAADLDALATAEPAGVVRLLPAFDPHVVAAPRDREAVLPAARQGRGVPPAGRPSPVLLVDGRIAGTWRHERRGPRSRSRSRRGPIRARRSSGRRRRGRAARGVPRRRPRPDHPALDSAARGGRSSAGRAPGCGPGGRGFESRRSPLVGPAGCGPFVVAGGPSGVVPGPEASSGINSAGHVGGCSPCGA